MSSQHPPNAPPKGQSQTHNVKSQGGSADTQTPGWRPYNGRWNANMAYRVHHHQAPRKEGAPQHNQTSRQSRPQHKKSLGNHLNHAIGSSNGQARKSTSLRQDAPSFQPSRSQGGANYLPTGQVEPLMMNPFPMFGGFSSFADPSVNHLPFFLPNTSEQTQQSQSFPTLDESLPNPAFFPFWNGGNPFVGTPPAMPPAAFMGFDMQAQVASNPMSNTINQLVTSNPTDLNETGPSGPNQQPNPYDNHQQTRGRKPPSATKTYFNQSSLPPQRSVTPRPLLAILDLNGTLIYRKTRKFPPSFQRRAGLDDFLKTLVQDYKVMIWSSSTPMTVNAVCKKIFSEADRKQLVAEWGRDRLNLSKSEYNTKIQVYKTLATVWSSKEVQAAYPKQRGAKKQSRWDQTNTILIDDSKLKALSEPYNLIEIPEFINAPDVDETTIFPRVLERLEILATCDDVSKMLHHWTSIAPETAILDLDLTPFQLNPESQTQTQPGPDPNIDPAATQKLNRKARKREKRAARQTAAALAEKESTPKNLPPSFADTTLKQSQPRNANVSSIIGKQRSPSPVSSVQSENSLLDRLERSLNS
ncbi:NLI interacting factor-like phosphatase-domain-containing protein [Aspergillus crustosus]